MRSNFGAFATLRRLSLVMGLCLLFAGCGKRETPIAKSAATAEPHSGPPTPVYSVDRIEGGIATLISRQEDRTPLQVPEGKLGSAQEGDILAETGDPASPFEVDEAETRRIKERVALYLTILQDKEAPCLECRPSPAGGLGPEAPSDQATKENPHGL